MTNAEKALTPIDKIRAALAQCLKEFTIESDPDDPLLSQIVEALSELDGCCVVPVEPTPEMIAAGKLQAQLDAVLKNGDTLLIKKAYAAMIAPYVNGEKK